MRKLNKPYVSETLSIASSKQEIIAQFFLQKSKIKTEKEKKSEI